MRLPYLFSFYFRKTATEEPKVSELITMQEAAQYCGRSHSQVQWYARSGQLRAWKVGMQWLTTEKEVDRYFKSRNSQKEWLNYCQEMTKFAKIRAGHRCEHCGRPEGFKIRCHILTVYHLDGDDTNWEPENLSLVCSLCYWYFHYPTFVENLFCDRSGDGRRKMLGSAHSLQDGFAQPLANGGWRIEGEGREVKREEKVGLGVWDRALLSLPVRERPWKCKPGR